jgi:hypothetical protein
MTEESEIARLASQPHTNRIAKPWNHGGGHLDVKTTSGGCLMSAVDYIHRLAQLTRLQAFIADGVACYVLKASRLSRPPTWLGGADEWRDHDAQKGWRCTDRALTRRREMETSRHHVL